MHQPDLGFIVMRAWVASNEDLNEKHFGLHPNGLPINNSTAALRAKVYHTTQMSFENVMNSFEFPGILSLARAAAAVAGGGRW